MSSKANSAKIFIALQKLKTEIEEEKSDLEYNGDVNSTEIDMLRTQLLDLETIIDGFFEIKEALS